MTEELPEVGTHFVLSAVRFFSISSSLFCPRKICPLHSKEQTISKSMQVEASLELAGVSCL